MRRVAVIGVGVTKFGRHERTSAELFAEAAADALADAEMPASRVQALYYGNVVGGETEKQLHTGPQAASILGIPAIPTTRFEAACASSHAAFRHAVMEIAAGVSDVVLVGGAERVLNVPTPESTEYFAYASDASWEQTLGLTFPGVFALIARAHMQRHGTTEAQMAAVAVKNHRHGALNPKAQFQKPITIEQVLKPAYVADPLKLYDCFTIAEIIATEGLGLFEPGAGGRAAEKGLTGLGGEIPVNPSGGLKAKGHPIGATGAAQVAEIVTQLRGEAGPRQVDGARTGMTHTLGGNTATVLVSLFGRD